MQGWLVVLELYDQVDLGTDAGFECLLWQCRASSVTRWPTRPSWPSSAWAAGISLDLSSMSLCGSTSAVSVAKTPSTCAAARSRNWSKLPRSVLPSIARLAALGLAQSRLQQAGMAAEDGLEGAAVEAL